MPRTFQPTTWTNESGPPYINATNMNRLEQGVKEALDNVDALAATVATDQELAAALSTYLQQVPPEFVDATELAAALAPYLQSIPSEYLKTYPVPFSVQGPLVVGRRTAFFRTLRAGQIKTLLADVVVAPTGSAATAGVYVDNVLKHTLTIPAGQTSVEVNGLSYSYASRAKVHVAVTGIGSTNPGEGLSVTAEMS